MFYLPSWHRALHLLLHLEFLLSLHVLLPKEVFVGTFLEPYCSQRLPPIILYQTVLTCLLHKTFHVKLHFSLAYLLTVSSTEIWTVREDTLWGFTYILGLPKMVKNLPPRQETQVQSLGRYTEELTFFTFHFSWQLYNLSSKLELFRGDCY